MISTGIISIDDGGSSTCVVTKDKKESFPSVKGLYGKRTLTESNGKYDYVVEYKGEKYVMGTLAKYDCRYPLEMHTDTKQNLFFDLSILVAIHQFGYSNNFVVTSVPITMHTEEEKTGRRGRLLGSHRITVNGISKTFNIMDVKVAPETAVGFWVNQPKGKSRYIDLGSRTIGYATTIYEDDTTRFIDSESGTYLGKGLEALSDDYDQSALADYICGRLLAKWNKDDVVYLMGGGALDKELAENIQKYFTKAVVFDNPRMVNSVGMYLLGRNVYDMA